MFATLLGTNRESQEYRHLCERLCQVAITRGFVPPAAGLRIQADQTSLEGWRLEQYGPSDTNADFLLAVTAPRVPGLSPIPVRKTVSGPLFAAIVMNDFVGVWRDDTRDYRECIGTDEVVRAFGAFLDSVDHTGTTDLPPDEFSLYVESLFFGRIVCSKCRSEFPLGSRPTHDDATWAASLAREAIHGGWGIGSDSRPVCPRCGAIDEAVAPGPTPKESL